VVAIVGGGLSGTLAAIQLLRSGNTPLLLRIFEPHEQLGRGLAYATPDYNHRLNGPAKSFSLRPHDPLHFARWLDKAAAAAPWKDFEHSAEAFAPRWVYGDYVRAELLDALASARQRVAFEHVRRKIVQVDAQGPRLQLVSEDGVHFAADHLVLALGVFATQGRWARDGALQAQAWYLPHPWQPQRLAALADRQKVLLIGSSLTMIDTVVALEARGYRGSYEVLSRHGLIPQARREPPAWPEFLALDAPSYSARGLLRAVRAQLAAALACGEDWQRLVPAVRPHLALLWGRASLAERRRFMRHVRPFWDVFLHRAPPPSAQVLDAVRAAGRLHSRASTLQRLAPDASGQVQVQLRPRGALHTETLRVDAVVDCVGFEYRWTHASDQPLVRSLLDGGLVRASPLGLGIDAVYDSLAVIGADGRVSSRISALGLPLRAVLLECATISELVKQAVLLAPRLAAVTAGRGRRCKR
jgi:uncharacterized NAD(P)/FAD-binding protein YdhS